MKDFKTKGIYGIVDPDACQGRDVVDVARAMLNGGLSIIQLRAKTLSTGKMLEIARELCSLCKQHGSFFIVNDRTDVALAAGAHGVHLGQDDLALEAARKITGPEFIIGISTHTIEEATIAQEMGADYLGFGAIYATGTKTGVTDPQGPARLAEIVRAVSIPVVAIGGISKQNLAQVANTGAAGAAMISALCAAEDVKAATQEMVSIWNDNKEM